MASKTASFNLKYLVSDYIKKLHKPEDEAVSAISDLIEDLHRDKAMTANHIINQVEIERLICQFFKLLKASLPIIVGNTAFILGTLAEFEEGRSKIIHILSLEDIDKNNSLDLLISLLDSEDSETLLNVTGTISSLVESNEGRHFMLSRSKSFSILLGKVNSLLSSHDLWIASNAALIIARVCIDEVGNSFILNSPLLDKIIINLVHCLSIDDAGRGMNAAFALGRIFDSGSTIVTYYSLIYKMQFIEKLVEMTAGSEMAFVKNSCFCLSSIMGSEKGFEFVLGDSSFGKLISNLEKLLCLNDDETVWFGVLTLKIISKKPKGCKVLRKTEDILNNIKKCLHNPSLSNEVKCECQEIINNLTPLEKPTKPNVTLISPYEVMVSWIYPDLKNDFEIKAYLYCKQDDDEILAYRGANHETIVKHLESNKKYDFYLKFASDIEITVSSDSCTIITAEDYPSEPQNLRILAVTSTQIKLGWDEPEKLNGTIKHYVIYMTTKNEETVKVGCFKSKRNLEQTTERSSIISGLLPNTRYTFSVVAVNACGKGSSAEIESFTLSSGAHAPERPFVSMLGRSEANVTWNPPEAPMGKIFRYEVKMNQRTIVYSGPNTYCKIANLKSESDYSFSVVVVTSEGRYESPTCRKRTGKDEYAGTYRAPLYESKPKSESSESTAAQKILSAFNIPNNSNKTSKTQECTNRGNSELDHNFKPTQRKSITNLTRPANKNSLNSDCFNQTIMTVRENSIDSQTKSQSIFQSQNKSKPKINKSLSTNSSAMSSSCHSISIPTLSSVDLSNISKTSSDTFVTNIKSRSSTEKSNLNSKPSSGNGHIKHVEPIKLPVKNLNGNIKNSSLQRKQSTMLR